MVNAATQMPQLQTMSKFYHIYRVVKPYHTNYIHDSMRGRRSMIVTNEVNNKAAIGGPAGCMVEKGLSIR